MMVWKDLCKEEKCEESWVFQYEDGKEGTCREVKEEMRDDA